MGAAYTGDDILPEGEGAASCSAGLLLRLTLTLLALAEGFFLGAGAVVCSITNHACCIPGLKVCQPIVYDLVPANLQRLLSHCSCCKQHKLKCVLLLLCTALQVSMA